MPAVALCDEQRRTNKARAFIRWVKSQIAETDTSQSELADVLGITQQALSHRLRNYIPFNHEHMIAIFQFFHATDDVILRYLRL